MESLSEGGEEGGPLGLDLGEGLETGVLEVMRILILKESVSNHSSKTDVGHEEGGGGGIKEGS